MKISRKIVLASLLSACGVGGAGVVYGADEPSLEKKEFAIEDPSPARKDFSVTVGLKAWANEWQSWNDPGSAGMGTAKATAINPSVTIKYKDFFVSGGFMPKKTYDVPSSLNGVTTQASRKEMDLSVGYYVHPQLALTLGYKQITQTWGTVDYVWKIPAVGLSAAAPLQGTNVFMYGNAAIGWASVSTNPASKAVVWNYKGGTYTTTEVGLGYAITPSFRLTGGYKYQVCPTSTEVLLNATRITVTDSTRGFVFGGSYTF